VSLRSVTVNGRLATIVGGNSVSLKNIAGPVDFEAEF
jgi:hypothetical protein